MIADEPTPKAKAIEQVLGALRSFVAFPAGPPHYSWTLEDICEVALIEVNTMPPSQAKDGVERALRRLATDLVGAFNIEV